MPLSNLCSNLHWMPIAVYVSAVEVTPNATKPASQIVHRTIVISETITMTEQDEDKQNRGAEWIGIGLSIGAGVGVLIGTALGSVAFGTPIGAGLGIVLGVFIMSLVREKETTDEADDSSR